MYAFKFCEVEGVCDDRVVMDTECVERRAQVFPDKFGVLSGFDAEELAKWRLWIVIAALFEAKFMCGEVAMYGVVDGVQWCTFVIVQK